MAVAVPPLPLFTIVVSVGCPSRNQLVIASVGPTPPTLPRRSKSHAFAPIATALSSMAFSALAILYVPIVMKSCQVM